MAASRDPKVFPRPDEVDLNRDVDLYVQYGIGPHKCLGWALSTAALTTMLKTVGCLENLWRAPGPEGKVNKVAVPHGLTLYMTEDQRSSFPFPTSMKVIWDGNLLPLRAR